MIETEPEEKTLAGVFPYMMILFALFLQGFLCLTLNGPRLMDLGTAHAHQGFRALAAAQLECYRGVLLPQGTSAGDGIGAAFVAFYSLMALIVGFVVQWVAGTLAAICQCLLSWPMRWLRNVPPDVAVLFSPSTFLEKEYPDFKIALLQHRAFKLEWEWELFTYDVYWGLFTNVTLFAVLAFMSVQAASRTLIVSAIIAWLFALFHCTMRSVTMRILHTRALAAVKDLSGPAQETAVSTQEPTPAPQGSSGNV